MNTEFSLVAISLRVHAPHEKACTLEAGADPLKYEAAVGKRKEK